MKQVVIYYLIGVAVFVIAGLLVYIGVASDVEAIYVALAAVALFGFVYLGGRGWDTGNAFIRRYKLGMVWLVTCLPPINLIVPYWVGRGTARLLNLDYAIESSFSSPTGSGRVQSSQKTVLETLLDSASNVIVESLEAEEYEKAIDSSTMWIVNVQEAVRDKPQLTPVYQTYLIKLYDLRARARCALGEQTGDEEQQKLALEDVEMALGYPEERYELDTLTALREFKSTIAGAC
jgi:hypothetical protein